MITLIQGENCFYLSRLYPLGFLHLIEFESIDDVWDFLQAMSQMANRYSTPVPQVFKNAWEGKDDR